MNISHMVLVLRNETWEGALEYCRKQYNDLASLSSLNMVDSALGKSTQAETEYVWIGLRYLAGDWFWVNGDYLDNTAWSRNEQSHCQRPSLRSPGQENKGLDTQRL